MENYRIISDLFAVPGLICLFWGALRWLSAQGAFRGVGYVAKNTLRLLTFRPSKPYAPKENRGRATRPLLLAGIIYLAIAGLFAMLYYQ